MNARPGSPGFLLKLLGATDGFSCGEAGSGGGMVWKEEQELASRGGLGCGKPEQPQTHLLPIRDDKGRGVPGTTASGVRCGLEARKPGVPGGPEIQRPAALTRRGRRGPELTPGPGLGQGTGGRGKRSHSHFPGQPSEVGLGRAEPKGLRPRSRFLFPTA